MVISLRTYTILILILMASLVTGCKIKYSFSGASISPDIKTVSVQFFPNRASLINPTLSQDFTDGLTDKIRGQTSLTMVSYSGDVEFDGEITDYRIEPVAISGDDRASLTRFTVAIRVKFTNQIDSEQNFDKVFTRYEDFDSAIDFSSVEQDLIEEIIEALTEDIFNQAFVNW